MAHVKDNEPHSATSKKYSLSRILILILTLTVAVVTIVTLSLIYAILSKKAKSQLGKKADDYVTSLTAVLDIPLWNLDNVAIERIGDAYSHDELVEKIKITDSMDNVYFDFHRESKSETVSRSSTIVHNGQTIGLLEISLSAKSYAQMNRHLLLSSLAILLAVVLVLIVVISYFSRLLLNNLLKRLNRIVNAYGSGRYDTSDPDMPFLEFQPLVDVLREMGDKITSQVTELRSAEQKYRSIFENALEGIFQTTTEGRVLSANPSLARILGYDSVDDIVNTLTDIGQQLYVDPQRRMELVQRIKKGETVTDFELQAYRKDGSKVWVSCNVRPVLDAGGTLTMIEGSLEDITNRKRAAIALEESEAKIRGILDNLEIGVVLISPDFKILEVNQRMREMYPDINPEEHPLCHHVFNAPSIDTMCDHCPTQKTFEDGQVHEMTIQTQRGQILRDYRIVSSPVLNTSGEIVSVIEMMDDITDQLSLESQLRQSQKMEAVGRLAGGVAHDFNNLLSIILGYGEIMLEGLSNHHPHHDPLEEIIRAGHRAKDLTRQLLAFGRNQVLEINPVDVNDVVTGFERLLRRVIGEDITLELDLSPEPCIVMADTGQLEQVFMNLAVNARDAMPDGGLLTIGTSVTVLDETFETGKSDIIPGEYVMVVVNDTGSGMDPRTLERIFEPFFTTKGTEKGTGLGLATSYGIIKQHDGGILVYSKPGTGTTFSIYLPLCKDKVLSQKKEITEPINLKGSETILLTEDNEHVRNLAFDILKRHGYNVISTASGDEALATLENYDGPLHLLLTDVVMPGMNGRELYERISSQSPEIKVIYMSGYTDDLIARRGVLEEGVHFIQKPFSLHILTSKVRTVLDEIE